MSMLGKNSFLVKIKKAQSDFVSWKMNSIYPFLLPYTY